jgi:hypothetical protein
MTKEQAIAKLKKSKNDAEWNDTIDEIKAANNGQYPTWWFKDVVQARLADEVFGSGSSDVTIQSV